MPDLTTFTPTKRVYKKMTTDNGHPGGLSSQATEPDVSALRASIPDACIVCGGAGWVCENHAEKPWGGMSSDERACECGAGMPCRLCNHAMSCAAYAPHWEHFSTAPANQQLLICGGEYEADDEIFPQWRPLSGYALVIKVGDGWQGDNCHSHDNWYWHRNFRWMLPPAKAIEARSGETERLDPKDESALACDLPKDTDHA